MARRVAGNDQTAVERKPRRMTLREGAPFVSGMSGWVSRRPTASIDLAPDPVAIGLAGDSFDDEAEQAKAMVGIFQPRAGRNRGRLLQLGQ